MPFREGLAFVYDALIGFGLNEDGIHSPDEHFALDRFKLGCKTHAILLAEVAQVRT